MTMILYCLTRKSLKHVIITKSLNLWTLYYRIDNFLLMIMIRKAKIKTNVTFESNVMTFIQMKIESRSRSLFRERSRFLTSRMKSTWEMSRFLSMLSEKKSWIQNCLIICFLKLEMMIVVRFLRIEVFSSFWRFKKLAWSVVFFANSKTFNENAMMMKSFVKLIILTMMMNEQKMRIWEIVINWNVKIDCFINVLKCFDFFSSSLQIRVVVVVVVVTKSWILALLTRSIKKLIEKTSSLMLSAFFNCRFRFKRISWVITFRILLCCVSMWLIRLSIWLQFCVNVVVDDRVSCLFWKRFVWFWES